MESSQTSENKQSYGQPSRKDPCFEKRWSNLCGELGKLSVVTGELRNAVFKFDIGRVESLQGPVHQAFQSAEKALKKLQEAYYPNGNTNTTGSTGSMVSSRDLRLGSAAGNEPHKISGKVSGSRSDEPPHSSYIQLED